MASCAPGFRPVRQIWSILSYSLRDIPVSGERIKMEKEIDPEGCWGCRWCRPRVFQGESWCPASQPPLSFSSICSEGGSLGLFAKSVSGARFWRWMEASLWSPIVRQEDLLDAGDQSSVTDDRFTGFLVPWEWDWLGCLLFQMVEMVCLHVISLMEALQECNSTIFVKVRTTYDFYRLFYITKINMDLL